MQPILQAVDGLRDEEKQEAQVESGPQVVFQTRNCLREARQEIQGPGRLQRDSARQRVVYARDSQ